MFYKQKYIKKDKKLFFIILLLLLITFIYVSTITNYLKKREEYLNLAIKDSENEYSMILAIYSDIANIMYDTVIKKDDIVELFYKGIKASDPIEQNKYRLKLYNKLEQLYSEINKYSFRQLHFHTAENISYLRFHKPEKYGDDLTGIRYSVEYVNKHICPIYGFEEGRINSGFRFVFPVFYNSEHIGSVEISCSIGAVIDHLHSNFKVPSQFIIRKDVVDNKVFESEKSNYTKWYLNKNYLLDKEIARNNILTTADSKEISDILLTLLEKSQKNSKPSAKAICYNGEYKIIVFLPIINFKNEVVAFLITFQDTNEFYTTWENFISHSIAFVVLFIVMIIFSCYYHVTNRKLIELSHHDFLTNTCMRRILMERIEIEINRSNRYHSKFSIIMIDIDHFKKVNDTFGHKTGDEVLKSISYTLKHSIRKTDTIGRYGGEEFVVILPETILKNASYLANNLRMKIEALSIENVGQITISCGVVEFEKNIKSAVEIVNNADTKLYIAKKSGRNMVES